MHTKTPVRWLINASTGVFFIPYLLLLMLNFAFVYALWPINSFNLFQISLGVLVSLLTNVLIIHTLYVKQKTSGFNYLVLDTNRCWQITDSNQNEYDVQVLQFWYGYFWLTIKIENIEQNKINHITIWKLNNDYAKWKQLVVCLEWEFTIGQTSNKGKDL